MRNIKCQHADNPGGFCLNKKVKKSMWGFGARTCIKFWKDSNYCEFHEDIPRPHAKVLEGLLNTAKGKEVIKGNKIHDLMRVNMYEPNDFFIDQLNRHGEFGEDWQGFSKVEINVFDLFGITSENIWVYDKKENYFEPILDYHLIPEEKDPNNLILLEFQAGTNIQNEIDIEGIYDFLKDRILDWEIALKEHLSDPFNWWPDKKRLNSFSFLTAWHWDSISHRTDCGYEYETNLVYEGIIDMDSLKVK